MRATLSALAIAALVATPGLVATATPPRASSGTSTPVAAAPRADDSRSTYRIVGDARPQRHAIAATGVDIEGPVGTQTIVTGTAPEIARLRSLGLTLTPALSSAQQANRRVAAVEAQRRGQGVLAQAAADFPAGDEGYHTVAETAAVLDATVRSYPNLASKRSIGTSVDGRDLTLLRLGTAPEGSPEVVITCNQHAREHLTTEQCLYLIQELTGKYATDQRVKTIMEQRIVWVMPIMNPDGSAYDIAGGSYEGWRKNRTRNSDGSIGIDLNRNWGYKWNCCGGASNSPSSDTYRGPFAFAAPETKAISSFIKSRRVDGTQRIKAYMDIHTYGQIVMWPFGHTRDQVTTGMTRDQYDMHAALGRKLASFNNYSPEQSSQMYITDGDSMDWVWGDQQIPTIGMEMYPGGSSGDGFYPPASIIPRETQRNRETLLTFLELADCQYRLTGKQAQYCSAQPGPTPPPPAGSNAVTNGDFEQGTTGWTGTTGTITTSAGVPAHSGSGVLLLGGNGTTSTEYQQQTVTVPANGKLTLWLRVVTKETSQYTAYDTAEVSIGGTAVASFSNMDASGDYVQKTVDLSAYAGKSVVLKLTAREDSSYATSFIIDDIRIA